MLWRGVGAWAWVARAQQQHCEAACITSPRYTRVIDCRGACPCACVVERAAAHGSVATNKSGCRWINHVVGRVSALPFVSSCVHTHTPASAHAHARPGPARVTRTQLPPPAAAHAPTPQTAFADLLNRWRAACVRVCVLRCASYPAFRYVSLRDVVLVGPSRGARLPTHRHHYSCAGVCRFTCNTTST